MRIDIDGKGGAFKDVLRKYPLVEMPQDQEICVETLEAGMSGGRPSCGIIVPLPNIKRVVLAQTSVRLFQTAAAAMYAKYGDVTGGAFTGVLDQRAGSVRLNLSDVVACVGCQREIPSSCKFCPECGMKAGGYGQPRV